MIFRDFVIKNFPILEDDFDALTDYQLFCKMVGYMKKSLEKIDGYQVEIDKFSEELKSFENWFDNLDVTEEVNAKLDEMVEDGTMEQLIAEYLQLQTTYTYDSVADLKLAENLVNGMFVRTSGYYAYNSGGGAFYKIREITNEDTVDELFILSLYDESLVAEYIVEDSAINVLQFGCKGDNEFDNTTILQSLIDVCESKGYVLNIPHGYYLISDTLYIDNRITINGVGSGKLWQGNANHSCIVGYLTDKPFIHISKSSTLYGWSTNVDHLVEHVHLNKLSFFGNEHGGYSITGVYANMYLSSIKDCTFSGFLNDLALSACYETIIENVQCMLSRQNIVVYYCNDTTIFKDVYCNGGFSTTGAEIIDQDYIDSYTIVHKYNYACVYINLGKPYFNNLAVENSCYGIISRDSLTFMDIVNIESISDCGAEHTINLNNNAKLTLDHVHFYNPSNYSGKLYHVGFRSRFSMNTIDPLPIANFASGTYSSRSIARVYSYITGYETIALTLSGNVTGATIVNKSHFTDLGFKIHYEIIDASTWLDSQVTTLTTLPSSNSFGNDAYNIITTPSKQKDVVYNLRVYGNGNILFSNGSWVYKSASSYLDNVIIDTEYIID